VSILSILNTLSTFEDAQGVHSRRCKLLIYKKVLKVLKFPTLGTFHPDLSAFALATARSGSGESINQDFEISLATPESSNHG